MDYTNIIVTHPKTNSWLVVLTILKNISQWEGLSHILWKNKKCAKPTTRIYHITVISVFGTVLRFPWWRFFWSRKGVSCGGWNTLGKIWPIYGCYDSSNGCTSTIIQIIPMIFPWYSHLIYIYPIIPLILLLESQFLMVKAPLWLVVNSIIFP